MEGHQHLLFKMVLPEYSQEVYLGLLNVVVLMDQESSSVMWTPRGLKDGTLSTQSSLMKTGVWAALFLLKSITSLVLIVFSCRLLSNTMFSATAPHPCKQSHLLQR